MPHGKASDYDKYRCNQLWVIASFFSDMMLAKWWIPQNLLLEAPLLSNVISSDFGLEFQVLHRKHYAGSDN